MAVTGWAASITAFAAASAAASASGPKIGTAQIDGAGVGAHVERHGFRIARHNECLRKDVLARVLLHVVEPARPIEDAAHFVPRKLSIEDVPHNPILNDDIQHGHALERPLIVRLSAAGRVERGAIESDRQLVTDNLSPDDTCRELAQIRILDVETLCRHDGHSFLANA